MEKIGWYDVLRSFTCLLCFASLMRLVLRARKLWSLSTPYIRDMWWILTAFMCLMIEGSIEQIVLDVQGGPRTLFSFIVACVCLRATLRKDPSYLRTD